MVQATQSIKPTKPVLRSISTIDENENTYNNVNFKRRRITATQQKTQATKTNTPAQPKSKAIAYNTTIDDDDNEDDLFANVSDDENIFNSDEDEYYSAISDYESDSKSPRFIMSKPLVHKQSLEDDLRSHMTTHLLTGDAMFDTDESEPDTPTTPISSTLMGSFGELKSLEENFQKIADENQHVSSASSPVYNSETEEPIASNVDIQDCVNYHDSLDETPEVSETKKQKFLQYRHDERHNLAFPDISTFPIRYDPLFAGMSLKKGSGRVRALNRRAILSGMASEMVGTGFTLGDFDMV